MDEFPTTFFGVFPPISKERNHTVSRASLKRVGKAADLGLGLGFLGATNGARGAQENH